MIEARVECICVVGYNLSDLGAVMRMGDVLWFPEARARASADLRTAERAKAVTVRWKERCSVARQPIPFFVKKPPRQPIPFFVTPPNKQVRQTQRKLAVEEVAAVPAPAPAVVQPEPVSSTSIVKEMSESLREVVKEEIQKALRDHVPAATHSRVPDAPASRGRPPDEPMFIPTGLVSQTDESPLNVASMTSESSGLDDAAEALKVVRRKKKES